MKLKDQIPPRARPRILPRAIPRTHLRNNARGMTPLAGIQRLVYVAVEISASERFRGNVN